MTSIIITIRRNWLVHVTDEKIQDINKVFSSVHIITSYATNVFASTGFMSYLQITWNLGVKILSMRNKCYLCILYGHTYCYSRLFVWLCFHSHWTNKMHSVLLAFLMLSQNKQTNKQTLTSFLFLIFSGVIIYSSTLHLHVSSLHPKKSVMQQCK